MSEFEGDSLLDIAEREFEDEYIPVMTEMFNNLDHLRSAEKGEVQETLESYSEALVFYPDQTFSDWSGELSEKYARLADSYGDGLSYRKMGTTSEFDEYGIDLGPIIVTSGEEPLFATICLNIDEERFDPERMLMNEFIF